MIYYGIRDSRGIMWKGKCWRQFKMNGLPALYRRTCDVTAKIRALEHASVKPWAKDDPAIYGQPPYERVEVLATILPVQI